jgi:predicted tellurium resistance membrane protein TerC
MKAYLVTTGTIFGLIGLMHILKSFADWHQLTTNPVEYAAMSALGLIAVALSVWGWRLFLLAKTRT